MEAVLCIDLKLRWSLVLFDILINFSGAETLLRAIVILPGHIWDGDVFNF
jgi:hypothetical protein